MDEASKKRASVRQDFWNSGQGVLGPKYSPRKMQKTGRDADAVSADAKRKKQVKTGG